MNFIKYSDRKTSVFEIQYTGFFFRIIVLDKGCVMEYDTPNHLLKDPNSLFYELARNAGILK